MTRSVEVARVYDSPRRQPGAYRVLVDRLWPRGVAKADLDLDEWARDVAPSTGLRRWYGHVPERFAEFERRYRAELGESPGIEAVERLLEAAGDRPLILLTATRDVARSGAAVLADVMSGRS